MQAATNKVPITDILFDLGRVLVPIDWNMAYTRLAPYLPDRLRLLMETDREAFQNLFLDSATELEMGRLGFDRFHQIVTHVLETRISLEEFHHIWCDIFRLDTRMVRLGRSLSRTYGTWLVSNTSEAHYQWIVTKFPEILFYRDAALSYKLGVMKPAAEYYQKALSLFRLNPASCVFIDDLSENVEGAVQAGMIGIVYKGTDQLLEELHNTGIAVSDLTE